MVNSCCIKTCPTIAGQGLKLHRIPKDLELQSKWLKFIQSIDQFFELKPSHVVCENHFCENDYSIPITSMNNQKKLKKDAVPSIISIMCLSSRRSLSFKSTINEIHDEIEEEVVTLPSEMLVDEISLNAVCDNELDEEVVPLPSEILVEEISLDTMSKDELVDEKSLTTPPSRFTHFSQRKRKVYVGDFESPSDIETPNSRLKYWHASQSVILEQKKKLKKLTNDNENLRNKIKNLSSLIEHLNEEKKLISENCYTVLKESISPLQTEIIMKQLNMSTGNSISPELRTFGLTLHFYSPAAYSYVREIFNKTLPHPSTIRKWYSTIDGTPGFSVECLNAVKLKVEEMGKKNKKLFCGLIMDEMSIREDIHYNGDRLQGYINFGQHKVDSDSLPLAREALVFLLVALNSNWKIPVGYFLMNGTTAAEKSNLVTTCLQNLNDTGVIVKSLTFDGAASNISMVKILGANLPTKPSFKHPNTREDVHIFLDAAHMLKLVRNTLGDWGTLYDQNGKSIEWDYFKKLVDLQEKGGLHLATKLRRRHIWYFKEKMKVSIAAQTFSASVADALTLCKKENFKGFQNSDSTIEFCKKINDIFDFLNTRNFLEQLQCKRPLYANLEGKIHKFVEDSIFYLESLKGQNNIPILESQRKTGFIGLITCLISVKQLFLDIVKSGQLDFILTYKLSQDHIEMLFSAIRSRGGFNNNPSAAQFEAAYKRLLIHTNLTVSNGANCSPQDATNILNVTQYKTFAIEHISGFIVKKILCVLKCKECAAELIDTNGRHKLIDIKNRGGLTKPSIDVVTLCEIAEKNFILWITQAIKNQKNYNVIQYLIIKCMSSINIKLYFVNLNKHIYSQSPINNHLLQIIKLILKYYNTIRLHHYNKELVGSKMRIRSKLTKIITFKNQ